MADDDRYFFRVYLNDGNGNLYSPYVGSDSTRTPERRQFMGSEYVAPEPDEDPELVNPRDTVSVWHKGRVHPGVRDYRHAGFSMIGRLHPDYSLYGDSMDPFEYAVDGYGGIDGLGDDIRAAVPESARHTRELARYYADGEDNDWDYLHNRMYGNSELLNGLRQLAGDKDRDKGVTSGTLSGRAIGFDSDDSYDSMIDNTRLVLNTVGGYDEYDGDTPYKDSEGHQLKVVPTIVAAPEKSLISVDDALEKKYDMDRDFPNEWLSMRMTPKDAVDRKAFDRYSELREKGASGRDAFGDSFDLDPDLSWSDEAVKDIRKDMSDEYGKWCDRQSICGGLKELGQ